MKRFKSVLVFGVFLFFCSKLWADVPQLINFQGVLKDGSGNPVANGSYSVTFTIYDAPAGGTAFWTETQSVTTSGGLFTVLLGATTPVPDSVFHDSSRYLGIAVSPDPEMTPRQRLSSVGYSSVSSQWASAGQNLFRLNGNVGIGTANPTAPLHIRTPGNYLGNFATTGSGDLIFNAVPGNSGRLVFNSNNLLSPIAFSIGNMEMMRIDASGYVGIGTPSPQAPLHVASSSGDVEIRITGSATGVANTAMTSFYKSDGTRVGYIGDASAGTDHIYLVADPFGRDIILHNSGTDALVVKPGGNVGVGTSVPAKKLEVAGGIKGDTVFSDVLSAPGGVAIRFLTGSTEQMRINSNPSLGIATTTPQNTLDVKGNAVIGFSYAGVNTAPASGLLVQGSVGVGTTSPGASSLLELSSTTKGFVLPRLSKAQRDAIASPVAGMMIYQTDNTPGLRVYNGVNWMRFTETAD